MVFFVSLVLSVNAVEYNAGAKSSSDRPKRKHKKKKDSDIYEYDTL